MDIDTLKRAYSAEATHIQVNNGKFFRLVGLWNVYHWTTDGWQPSVFDVDDLNTDFFEKIDYSPLNGD